MNRFEMLYYFQYATEKLIVLQPQIVKSDQNDEYFQLSILFGTLAVAFSGNHVG